NGFSMGLTGPLVSYWFALKFHTGPEQIAPVMAATFALAAVMSLYAGHMAVRHGLSRAVVWSRGIGVVMLLALPFMPWFWLAAVLQAAYVLGYDRMFGRYDRRADRVQLNETR